MSDPRSLRSRLIALYTACTFIVFATLGLLVVAIAFAAITRPLANDLARAVRTAEAIVASAQPAQSVDAIQRRIAQRENGRRLVAVAVPPGPESQRPPGMPSGEIELDALFGLAPVFVPVRDGSAVILPDRDRVEALFRGLYAFIALTLALALWAA